jgi:hypothetical protein
MEESSRDYLVANHILEYQEFPLVGPISTFPDSTYSRHSAFYFYFLAFLLAIKNNISFLNIVNVFLQVLTGLIIYIIAKKIYGAGAGLTALVLYLFSAVSLYQSSFIWGPHVMLPFLNLSFLLLLTSQIKRNFLILQLSVFMLISASAIYGPALLVLPVFLALAVFSLWYRREKLNRYLLLLITLVVSLAIFYFPFLVYLNKLNINPLKFLFSDLEQRVQFSQFTGDFGQSSATLARAFFLGESKNFWSLPHFLIMIVAICTLYFFIFSKDTRKNFFSYTIILLLLQVIFFAAVFNEPQATSRFLLPIYGLFIVFIAGMINRVFCKGFLAVLTKLLIIGLLLTSLSGNFDIVSSFKSHNDNRTKAPGAREEGSLYSAVDSIKREISEIKKAEGVENEEFFDVRAYRFLKYDAKFPQNPARLVRFDSAFWVLLERDLNRKFTKVDDFKNRSYEVTNKDKYIFLICMIYPNEDFKDIDCTENFFREQPDYSVMRRIRDVYPYSIYLMGKQDRLN